jgi:endonuclease VIII-like 3
MESQQRIRMMEELDVCSPKFSFSRAEAEVKKQRGRMLCDVLLDQKVLPGVGNIIKNEALFHSGLHPAVKVNKYCLKLFLILSELVLNTFKGPVWNT